MFKKQVSWTDAGQKFVHPIRKGDVFKKIAIMPSVWCMQQPEAETLTPTVQEDTDTALHLQVLPTGSFITAQNPNEIKQVILKI